jgi:ABC-2 type transport system permease protein
MPILKTLKAFWSSALAAEMEYRLNFVVAAVTSSGYLAGSVFVVYRLGSGGRTIGGWPIDHALIVVALFTLLEGITSTVLSPNLSRIVQHVQRGTLDFVLLKPLDAQVWVSLRQFSPWGFPSLLFAGALLGYEAWKLSLAPAAVLVALLPIALAAVILYSVWFVVATTTIWFTKVWNATEVLRSFLEAGRYPVSAYPAAFQLFFKFVLPVAFLTTVPAEAMLGRASSAWLWAEAVLAAGLFWGSRLFWKIALRSYTSASS